MIAVLIIFGVDMQIQLLSILSTFMKNQYTSDSTEL